jgi:hypothetical protein
MLEDELDKAIPKIAEDAKTFWKQEAAKRLHSTLQAYQKSLVVNNHGYGDYSVTLGGRGGRASKEDRWLANALENGTPGWDMKPGYLKGAASRIVPLMTKDKGLIFRTVRNSEQRTPWKHPGFKGIKIGPMVIQELAEVIIPAYIHDILDKLTS